MNMLSLHRFSVLFALCLGMALLAPAPGAQAQNVFTVDDNGDGSDTNAGNGACETSGGVCTLRAAIEETNALANVDSSTPDRIAFSISTSSVINPGTALPEITDPLLIDGTTASIGAVPRLRIDTAPGGFVISAGSSTLRGLQITRSSGNGLTLTGAGGNVIENCQIGDFLSLGSPAGYGNDGNGILITGGSTQNRIGDSDDAGSRNIIGGNGGNGIRIDGGDPSGPNNRIYGNYIGVAADGETDLGNTGHGVLLENQTSDNYLGTATTGDLGNVISGNGGSGVTVSGTFGNAASSNTSGNSILNNRIGLNDAGDTAVPNDLHGVHVDGATETRIGATGVGASVISGNGQYGVYLFGTDITVRGNRIGTDAAGTTAIGNGPSQAGIILVGSTSGVTIGGSSSAYRNVVSGNERGIVLNSATDNTIEGNYIGVDAAGDAALGNEFEGIRLGGASKNNTIGGTASGAGNVISGNGANGILMTGSSATGNAVIGNHIGVNAGGDADLGNSESGIVVEDGASGNTMGGTTGAARNVISGNGSSGITLNGFDGETSGNVVQGNYIGTDAAGTSGLGNDAHGVNLFYGPPFASLQNVVGGSAAGAGNLIADNGFSGIRIFASDDNTVQGNRIGVDADGNPLGNAQQGISISSVTGTTVGGVGSGEGNVIAHNGEEGLLITVGNVSSTFRNTVRGNAVFSNGDLGLDLGDDGRTANDPGDGDGSPNNLQNFPVVESADYDPGTDEITATYVVDTDPANATYPLAVDFYQADADGEEGAAYLGTDSYTSTDHGNCGAAPCTKTVTFTPQAPVTRSDLTVATATDDAGNTSEFSVDAGALPVELAAFEAAPAGTGTVALTWQTASETNNDRFRVERQREGDAGWAKLGTRQSQAPGGTSSEALRYRFEDTSLPFEASALTYRLVQRDLDGTETVAGEKTVEIGAPRAFTLHGSFPNPMRSRTTIRYELPEERRVTVAVYDVLGRKVRTLVDEEQTGRQEIPFEAGGLSSGTYFYRITAGDYTQTRKLVLVR